MSPKRTTIDVDAAVRGQAAIVDAKNQLAVDQAMRRLREEAAHNKHLYQDVQAAFDLYKAEHSLLENVSADFTEPKPIVPRKASGDSESTLVAIGCDWHVYETVKPEQVNGLNEYNPTIAKAGVEAFHRGIVRWAEIHRAGTRIDTCVVAYLGDLMSGMLHEDQMEGNAGTPLEEALFVTELVVAGLDYVLAHGGFERVIVLTCDGNHSRITEKKRKANRVKHSLEWLIFRFVEQRYAERKEKRIEFHVADGIHSYLALDYAGGKTLRFSHGDEGIQYQGGVGGLSVSANRSIDKWNVGRKADLDFFGHWHTSEHPRRYVAVGSVLGYSPYALAGKFEYELPAQALVLFEKNRWETAYHRLYVR